MTVYQDGATLSAIGDAADDAVTIRDYGYGTFEVVATGATGPATR